MKKTILYLFSALLLFSFQLFAQLNDYAFKIGVQGGYVSPDTYFQPDGISYQAGLFARFELGRYFDLGLGAGYG
jgi:hypothetical protein